MWMVTIAKSRTSAHSKFTDQNNIIRVGCKDLRFYVRLGTKLHARLNQVDRILKGSRWAPGSVRAIL